MKYLIWYQSCMGAGSSKAFKILNILGSAEAIFNMTYNERKKSNLFTYNELERFNKTSLSESEKIIEECNKTGIKFIAYNSSLYPFCLSVIHNPPVLLYYKGTFPDFDNTPSICIVGPRKVSNYGKKAAYSLSNRLSKAGFIIISGGALGTDTCAHSGALKCKGITALVMGCGINCDYLPENKELRNAICEKGCLISEYPPLFIGSRFTFPVRNRIMSALSLGTVVIEASEKSGALITANCANEQGRDVFAIPGSPNAAEYKGSNALIRDGAKIVLDASDIFNEYIGRFADKINISNAYKKEEKVVKNDKKITSIKNFLPETLSNNAKIVYNHLDKHKFYPEEIKNTNLNPGDILSALTELEMEFLVKSMPGGIYEKSTR